jgi:hypothetical protein
MRRKRTEEKKTFDFLVVLQSILNQLETITNRHEHLGF